jgi:hypothetical protein
MIIKIRVCKLSQALPTDLAWLAAGKHSLAGQLLQGASRLVFVGASLLAKGGGEQSSPQANNRWQASSYRGQASLFL